MNPITRTVPFAIHLPATEVRKARHVETIEIEVYENFGEDFVTPESTALIEKVQARCMGLLATEDLAAACEKIPCPTHELAELLGCTQRDLSRWQAGRGYPPRPVNSLLRLLHEDRISLDDLRAITKSFSSK